ncbi:hypothetical protein ABZ646_26200, partial [Streptomyces sp. NPDC007162]
GGVGGDADGGVGAGLDLGGGGAVDRVDAIASDVQEVTSNASALSTTVASTFGGPLVKVAAFGYGVRRALAGRKADVPVKEPRRTVIVGRTVPAARRKNRGK